jgi:branched-chain amino acid transport system permease protein
MTNQRPFLHGRRLLTWAATALVLITLPMIFTQSFAISMLSQMGIAIIFALSYNMLLGQTGMLSFGHAVYFGLGAFISVHTLNAIGDGTFHWPVTLIPVIGGLAGMFFGIIFGYVTTKHSGTPFAMISLGIAEMVAACSLMFPTFFGGEGGISTDRAAGEPFMGITYGPGIQVYYLIAGWCFLSMVAMFALTQTPLGRMANAVRDNAERARFVGYNPTRVRYMMLILSSFFAGIAGSLAAMNYELVTAENVGVVASGNVLLMAFIGGVGHFFGPIIGATLVTFIQSALSNYTLAWLLYFGLFFLVMILFAPGGIASLITLHKDAWQVSQMRRLMPAYVAAALAGLVALLGLIGLIEMTYQVETKAEQSGTAMSLFGIAFDAATPTPWITSAAILVVGGLLLWAASRRVRASWAAVALVINARRSA